MKLRSKLIALFCSCILSYSYAETPDFRWVGFGVEPTGGNGGNTYVVNTFSDLVRHASSSERCIIKIDGRIYNGKKGGKVSVRSNKTLLGIGSDALLDGIGLELKDGVNNIIIQNLKLTMTGFTYRGEDDPNGTEESSIWDYDGDEGRPQIKMNDGDCIHITNNVKNVWIDHCELYNEDPAIQTNQDLYDGLIDVKRGCQFITVSWCYIHDHYKCSLVGSSASDTYDWKITYHHNYYRNIRGRTPSYRGGTGHIFNNYWERCGEGVNARQRSSVYVEHNDFSGVSNNRRIFCADNNNQGTWTAVGNIANRTAISIANTNSMERPNYDYVSVLEDASTVQATVKAWAGVGKLNASTDVEKISKDKGEIISEAYYTLSGIKISQPVNKGIYIKRLVYQNGHTETVKIMCQ